MSLLCILSCFDKFFVHIISDHSYAKICVKLHVHELFDRRHERGTAMNEVDR